MDVSVSELRAHLGEWLERARNGQEVVVTDRGLPVVRMLGVTTASTLERLTEQGVIGRPVRRPRPVASGRRRPRAHRSISDIVSEERD